jgi:hypothetical protein
MTNPSPMTEQPPATTLESSQGANQVLILIKSTALGFYGIYNFYLLVVEADRASVHDLHGLLSSALSVLLFVQLVLLWIPVSLTPGIWKRNRNLRRVVALSFPPMLASVCAASLWAHNATTDWAIWAIWHGPIGMLALTVKWWWDGDDGLLASLGLIAIGLVLGILTMNTGLFV